MGRSPQQERSQRRRDALLEAAVDLMAEGGMPAITHRAVAARAGVPASTAGYFFASIDDLAAEALRVFTNRAMADYRKVAEANPDIEQLIEVIARRGVDPRLAMAQVTAYIEARRTPAMREPAAEALDGFRRGAEEILRAAGLPSAAAASPAFVALLDGFMLAHLAKPDSPLDPDMLIEALSALFAGFLLTQDERRSRIRHQP
jgi:DNA-binding transcriptional regulator YbjK